jgi:hypothetical protein
MKRQPGHHQGFSVIGHCGWDGTTDPGRLMGSAGPIATALKQLDPSSVVEVVAALGADPPARKILTYFQDRGISLLGIQQQDHRATWTTSPESSAPLASYGWDDFRRRTSMAAVCISPKARPADEAKSSDIFKLLAAEEFRVCALISAEAAGPSGVPPERLIGADFALLQTPSTEEKTSVSALLQSGVLLAGIIINAHGVVRVARRENITKVSWPGPLGPDTQASFALACAAYLHGLHQGFDPEHLVEFVAASGWVGSHRPNHITDESLTVIDILGLSHRARLGRNPYAQGERPHGEPA